jgi:hypothetical protein
MMVLMDFSNSSIFYRKDRKLGEGRDNNYITTETITEENCEIKWCKINIAGNQPLHIGAFNRPNFARVFST